MAGVSPQPAPGDDANLLAAQRAAIAVLRASADALLDPCVLLAAARDSAGGIVDFCFLQVNQATCDYIGLSRAELVGRSITEGTPGIKDAMLPALIRCLDTGDPLIVNDFAYDNEFFLDTRRYDLRATRATPDNIVVTWRDTTARYQTEQRLAISEARYRHTIDNAAVAMCLAAPDGRFTEVNDAMCSLTGYRRELQSAVDGNTVNMDVERAAFAENALHYEASVTFINGMLRSMNTAITGQ